MISLCVERRNYAHRPDLDEGYRIVDYGGPHSDTMIKEL